MTIRASKFTPEVLLSAPRRSAGLPNADGSQVLYTTSTYSFENSNKKSEVRILYLASQSTHLVTDAKGAREPQWIDGDQVILLLPGEGGATQIVIGNTVRFEESQYVVGTIDASVSNLKIVKLSQGRYAIALTSKSTPEGEFYNPEKAEKPKTTGRLYTRNFVRHWDEWITPDRNSIWFGTLIAGDDQRYQLSSLTNLLKDTVLESPIPPFGGTDHFDLSKDGIIFTAKDPSLNFATNTKTIVGYTRINFSENLTASEASEHIEIHPPGFEGATTGLVLSPDGKQAAFLKMKENGYEADKNQLVIIPSIDQPNWTVVAFPAEDGKGVWELSPQSITWSNDSHFLFLTAEDKGRTLLFSVARKDVPSLNSSVLKPFPYVANISDVQTLANDSLFISGSSLIDNSLYYTVEVSNPQNVKILSSNSKNGAIFGLSPGQVDQYWWPGAKPGTQVHGWVVKPSNFNPKNKYPLAYAIHGGPQGAWLDSWSTRWNPAVIAEQGYVVVCPNPTGSTGYGQDFTDAIQGQWGGLPYEDLVKGFEFIEKNIAYIDIDRAVALGASYGGFMINWIAGQPLGRHFKALVCHDGVFSMTGQLASEESYFPFHDLKGPLWKNPESWARWDPSRFTDNWKTPMLVIHSELDYRLTVAEGLSMFNVLQTKGIESQLLTFPDENHWVLKPENSLLWHTVIFDFINPKVGLPSLSQNDSLARQRKKEAWSDRGDRSKDITAAVGELSL